MPDEAGRNHLSDNQYKILVTRLLVNRQGELDQGFLVDKKLKIISPFRQLDELAELIARWLEASSKE